MKETEEMKKLKSIGMKIIEAPEWLLEQKIGGKNKNLIQGMAAIKITEESEKAVKAIGTRIPKPELTDEQKVTMLKLYQTVPTWIPKSQIKIVE